mgnify:CR=1 FL=1
MAWTTATERVLQFDTELFGRDTGTARVCRAGDHEFYIVLLIQGRDVDDALTSLDVSGASSKTLVLIDPNGLRQRKTLANRTDGSDGIIQYQIAAGDLDEEGEWQLYAEMVFSSSDRESTNRSSLHVEGANYFAPQKKKLEAYSVTSHDASAAAATYPIYVRNNSDSLLIVDSIRVGSVEASLWKLWYVTGTAAGGSVLTPTNLDDSNAAAPITARGGDSVTGLTAGSQIGAMRCEATGEATTSTPIVLGQGVAIALEYDTGTTGIAEITIVGHYED